MTNVVYQPCTNKASRDNLQKTIYNAVHLNEIEPFLPKYEMDHLKRLYPEGKVQLWGVSKNVNTKRSINELTPGDVSIFNVKSVFRIAGVVTYKTENRKLAEHLWGVKDDSGNETWEWLYFLQDVTTIAAKYDDVISNTSATQNRFFFRFNDEDSAVILDNLKIANLELSTDQEPTREDVDKEIEKDESVDGKTETRTRKEHAAIVFNVFKNRPKRDCVICGKTYPRAYLRAAHIKKRSECSLSQKKDVENVATSMCVFGCDSLYENGLISVSKEGKVIAHPTLIPDGAIKRYVSEIEGRTCNDYSTKNSKYFKWHREKFGFETTGKK